MNELTGKQARYLRGLGHHLQPVVMVGREGVSDPVIASAEEALLAHELVKVKVQEGCDADRREVAAIIARKTGSVVVQVLGRTILLFRAGENGGIELPAGPQTRS